MEIEVARPKYINVKEADISKQTNNLNKVTGLEAFLAISVYVFPGVQRQQSWLLGNYLTMTT